MTQKFMGKQWNERKFAATEWTPLISPSPTYFGRKFVGNEIRDLTNSQIYKKDNCNHVLTSSTLI